MNLIAIAAVDKNWAIGNKGKLLVRIPDDQRFFRETTTGHTVIMGRKTLSEFPNGRPLKNRRNLVLTRNESLTIPDAETLHDIDSLKAYLKTIEDMETEAYVIGGGSIYQALLPLCDTALITKIDYAYEADTYFPNLEQDPAWTLFEAGEEETYFDLCYSFQTYHRR